MVSRSYGEEAFLMKSVCPFAMARLCGPATEAVVIASDQLAK